MSLTFPLWLAQQHPQFAQAGTQAGAAAVLALAEGGATVPFIARYRKEQTGNLDEVAIRQVLDTKERWDDLVKRQAFIVEEIGRQGKLTPELEARIRGTFDPVAARGHLPSLQAETKDQGRDRARGGAGAAGGVALGLRARGERRGRDPRGARRRVRRRGQGGRRRIGGAGGRVRHRGGAAVRGRGAPPAGAQRLLRARLRPHAQGRQGQDPQPVRELLRVPGAGQGAAQAGELAPLPGDAARVDGGGAGADAGRTPRRRRHHRSA